MDYSIDQKMRGEDLHGLPCRVPTPTDAQSKCSHTTRVWVESKWEDYDGNMHDDGKYEEVTTCQDVPGTNNFRCTRCGYTRRY